MQEVGVQSVRTRQRTRHDHKATRIAQSQDQVLGRVQHQQAQAHCVLEAGVGKAVEVRSHHHCRPMRVVFVLQLFQQSRRRARARVSRLGHRIGRLAVAQDGANAHLTWRPFQIQQRAFVQHAIDRLQLPISNALVLPGRTGK